jgi:ATP-dependent DNA helicase RecG
LRFEDRPEYPLLAVREFVLNAVVHRMYEGTNAPARLYWFKDRVEIQSPGGLYGQVTPENYERVSDYRKPVLAEAMKVLGYVERFGTGIARANAALWANGNPPAEFRFEPTHVAVTVRRRP